MSLPRVLADTSAWIETLRQGGDAGVRATLTELLLDGRIVFCDLVRLDLWNGARGAADRKLLSELEANVETVPTTAEVWDLARRLGRFCRDHGLRLPAADLVIPACAEHHGLTILHRDAHFDRLAELRANHPSE